MRIFTASLATETNTFAPLPTGLMSFKEEGGYFPAGEHPDRMTLFSGPLAAARQRAREQGWQLVEGMVAFAQPGGITTRAAHEALRDELLNDLRAALPVDMVLLGLHGAMVADGCDDCEGDLLQRVRSLVGPGVVVGAELDPHNHLTPLMVSQADLLIAFKEYPHTDVLERGLELVDLCAAQVAGRIRPVAAVADCAMVSIIHTTHQPARGFVDRIQALEGRDGVLSISISHGFPWGDVADMGTRVLVYTDADADAAQRLARRLADELVALRAELGSPQWGIAAALDQALASPGRPVVMADGADNPGGGAAGDSTFILRQVLDRGLDDVAMGPLWDPMAVRLAFEAGMGARLSLRLGGKTSPLSGDPVDAVCTIRALHKDMVMTGLAGTPVPLGDCALVQLDAATPRDAGAVVMPAVRQAVPAHRAGVQIVLISRRSQALGLDLFTGLGLDPALSRIVVLKSSQHFRAAFGPIAAQVIYVDAPGSVTNDLGSLAYRKARRDLWPLAGVFRR